MRALEVCDLFAWMGRTLEQTLRMFAADGLVILRGEEQDGHINTLHYFLQLQFVRFELSFLLDAALEETVPQFD